MFCKKCGNELLEGDAFCNKCGTPVNSTPVNNASVGDIPTNNIPLNNEPVGTTPEMEPQIVEQPKKKKTGLIILVAALVVVAVALVVVALCVTGVINLKKDKKETATETTVEVTTVEETTVEETIEETTLENIVNTDSTKGIVVGSTYFNEFFKIAFETPDNFTISDNPTYLQDFMASSSSGSNLNIIIEENSTGQSAKDMIEQNKKAIESAVEEGTVKGSKVKMGKVNKAELAGQEFVSVTYSVKVSGVKMKVNQYIREENGYFIIITLTDVGEDMSKMLNAIKAY